MKHIYSFLFLVLLLSCNTSKKKIVLKIQKIYGVSNTSNVTLNKQKIGQVKILINQPYDEIIVESNKIDISKIPIDSKLQISDYSKFKKFELSIVIGQSIKYFKSGDTLSLFKSNAEKELEKSILVGDYIFVTNKKGAVRKTKVK